MRFIETLCPPALLYLIFLVVQLGLDLSLGLWVTFTIKLVLGAAVVKVLDTFCGIGLSPVSWFLVAAPFVITALATLYPAAQASRLYPVDAIRHE